MMGGPVDPDLDHSIRSKIGDFPEAILDDGKGFCPPLVIKYISPKYATMYHKPGQKLYISQTPGFTWGRATYVTPLAFPLSTGIFGRVGIIAGITPLRERHRKGWQTFDATKPENERVYLQWLQTRPLYRKFALTAHSGYIGQMLRDQFRLRYGIDCVLFRPDQSNPRYTRTRSDIWMAVTDWRKMPSGETTIATGFSDMFKDPRLTVVLEEEFENRLGGVHRAGLLNLSAGTFGDDLTERFFRAYHKGEILRIPS